MKKQRINQFLTMTLVFTLLLSFQSSCSYGYGIKGNGNVVKQERNVGSFSGLDVGGAFQVFLTQGDKESIIVEADENLQDIIETVVKGNMLKISTNEDINDSEALNIYITFKQIYEMEISGACNLTSENKLKFNDLELDCSGASQVDLKMSANDLEIDCSGASQIDLFGSANNIDLDVSGASHYDALDLEADVYNVDCSGAAHAKIFVNNELYADVSGASSLKYKGDATLKQHDVSGAAHLKKY